ncbi:MAG TPA: hypothetical protein VE177_07140, partial [Candidatus Binatus sp.]|nr:hypothetical protein [Candidatus Binatus sp.]
MSVSTRAGSPASAPLTITGLNGYTGVVSLSFSVFPTSGLSCGLSVSNVTLGASGVSTLSCVGTAGVYDATVTGRSSSLSHQVLITFTVQDFSVSAPTSMTVNATATGNAIVSVQSTNGFTGNVNLTLNIAPATGLSCTLSPVSVTLGTSSTSTLSCSGSVGSYSATVVGTSGTLTHSVTVQVTVEDFTVGSSPGLVIFIAFSRGNSTITVSPVNGYRGAVTLTVSAPGSLSCLITPASISLGPSSTATLSCTGSATGTYQATLTGASSPLTHSITVSFTVSDFTIAQTPKDLNLGAAGVSSSNTLRSVNNFVGTI